MFYALIYEGLTVISLFLSFFPLPPHLSLSVSGPFLPLLLPQTIVSGQRHCVHRFLLLCGSYLIILSLSNRLNKL